MGRRCSIGEGEGHTAVEAVNVEGDFEGLLM